MVIWTGWRSGDGKMWFESIRMTKWVNRISWWVGKVMEKKKKKRSNRLFDVWGLSNWKIKFLLTDKKTVEKYVWVGLEGRQCGAYLIWVLLCIQVKMFPPWEFGLCDSGVQGRCLNFIFKFKFVICIICLHSTYEWCHMIFVFWSLSGFLHLVWWSLGPFMPLETALLHLF